MIYEVRVWLGGWVSPVYMRQIVERDEPPTIIRCVILTPHVIFLQFYLLDLPRKTLIFENNKARHLSSSDLQFN